MRTALACCLSFVISCSQSRSAPPAAPAPASNRIDPLEDIFALPPGNCLGLDDHYVMSTMAVRMMLVNERERETQHALDVVGCKREAQIANARADAAEKDINSSAFWLRWGPIVGAGIGLVVGAAVPTAALVLRR